MSKDPSIEDQLTKQLDDGAGTIFDIVDQNAGRMSRSEIEEKLKEFLGDYMQKRLRLMVDLTPVCGS